MSQPSHASDEIATAVGWVAIEAARVELVAAQLEAAMIGTPDAIPVTVGQGWTPTKQALEALIMGRLEHLTKHSAEDRVDIALLEQTRATVRSADSLMLQRANVVHALWEPSLTAGLRTSLTLKRWGKYRRAEWSLDALERLRHALQAVHDELENHFVREVGPPDDE